MYTHVGLEAAVAAAVTGVAIVAYSFWRRSRCHNRGAGFEHVYINQDGSAREVSPAERAYLSTEYSGADGGRPYVKDRYESRDGWGSQSGFIERRRLPVRVTVLPVHPNLDQRVQQLGFDPHGSDRAAGNLIERRADGSVLITPNPSIPPQRRFELSRHYMLEQQRRREAMARPEL